MERNIISDKKLQRTVCNIVRTVVEIPRSRVTVDVQNENRLVEVKTKYTHVSDYRLEWCDSKGHYRVYILVADEFGNKVKPKYSSMTIRDGVVASGFVTMFEFLIRNRANQKVVA